MFLWSDYKDWSLDLYLLLIIWGIAFYMLTVVLYPPDIPSDEHYDELFEQNRKWLFGTFALFVFLGVDQTALRGELFQPRMYLPSVLYYAVLTAIGIPLGDRRYQAFLAWYVPIRLTLWSLFIRRLLVA